MHGLQACLFKYITVAAFRVYAQRGEEMKMQLKLQNLETMHLIVMEITLLIVENHGKIMELCFLISVGTLTLPNSPYANWYFIAFLWYAICWIPKK